MDLLTKFSSELFAWDSGRDCLPDRWLLAPGPGNRGPARSFSMTLELRFASALRFATLTQWAELESAVELCRLARDKGADPSRFDNDLLQVISAVEKYHGQSD